MTSERRDTLSITAAVAAVLALVASLFAVGLAARAVDEDEGTAVAAGGPADDAVEVSLTEFAIAPSTLSVGAGGSLAVRNDGATAHDLTVKGTDVTTGALAAGAAATLDLSDLEPGDYTVFCSVAGHEAAGMTGTLTVGEGEGEGGGHAAMDADDMDEVMAARTRAFPAETEGVGGQRLAPTIVDGVKQFDLTASVVDWEVEPGKTVEAWAYNGVVPGPTIELAVGDRVRVVLKNELPESTSIHFHGVHTPNSQDGVPDITQAPVKPGATFTYEFVAKDPTVAMYHSHHDAAKQVTNGLLGTFLIGDMPVPAGVSVSQEIPMVLNDSGTIGFSLNGKSFPATAPIVAKQGEWVEVHYLNEGEMVHPMHLHGLDQLVIAKDGFPLPQPYKADTVLVGPGERYTVLVEADEPGVWAYHCHILSHAEREDGMFGMVTAFIVE